MKLNKNIFISHSSANKEIAEQLTAFLSRLGIKENNIFCSSIIGQGVDNGQKLNEAISIAIHKSKLLIYIISYDFLLSSYCIEELGAGWHLAQQKKATCFYLVLPDIKHTEIKGFVNSNIDKFTFIDTNRKDELALLAENICKTLHIKMPSHLNESNSENTFFNSVAPYIQKLIKQKELKMSSENEWQKKIDELNKEIINKNALIKKYSENAQKDDANQEKHDQLVELKSIVKYFHILAYPYGIDKETYSKISKDFWFYIVNRYEELTQELNLKSFDAELEKIVASIYAFNNNTEQALMHIKKYVTFNKSSLYVYMIEHFLEEYHGTLQDIINILKEKISKEKEGLVKDSYVKTVKFLEEREQKLKK